MKLRKKYIQLLILMIADELTFAKRHIDLTYPFR